MKKRRAVVFAGDIMTTYEEIMAEMTVLAQGQSVRLTARDYVRWGELLLLTKAWVKKKRLKWEPELERLAAMFAKQKRQLQRYMAVAMSSGTLHLIDVGTAKLTTLTTGRRDPKVSLKNPIPQQLVFAPNGKTLVCRDSQGVVSVWELASGKRRVRQANRPGPVAFSPDGRLLATADEADVIHLWDTATGEDRARLPGHLGAITALAFSPDGTRLYSGSNDTTVLTWAVPLARVGSADTSAEDLDKRWETLKGDDAEKAFAALHDFIAARRTVAFLRENLKPEQPIEARHLEQLLAELGSEDFETREAATRELTASGGQAERALAALLAGKPAPEARRRGEELLRGLRETRLTGEALRQARAVEILEVIGDEQARELLAVLAKGAEGAHLTRQARESLQWSASRK